MKSKEPKEKPTPIRCVCGAEATTVVFRGKKMVSCPNPERCAGNFRTEWKGRMEEAIADWNGMINSFKYTRR